MNLRTIFRWDCSKNVNFELWNTLGFSTLWHRYNITYYIHMLKYQVKNSPSDTNRKPGGCGHHISQSEHKFPQSMRKCTCTVGTSGTDRNRSRSRIRDGNRKKANRCNPEGSCTPARRWSLRIWCFGHTGWGSIVLLESVWFRFRFKFK